MAEPCGPCAHALLRGWWGQDGTHCRKCHRSWTAFRQIHCSSCCRHFSSPSTLDLHKSNGGCIDPGTVVRASTGAALLRLRPEDGVWVGNVERPEFYVKPDAD